MFRLLTADAVFIAAVFVETLAALSLLEDARAIAPREEFDPVLAFYRAELAPALAPGAGIVWARAPQWFVDATLIAPVFFFLFFIAQARNAMAPYGGERVRAGCGGNRLEAAIDWVLPPIFCAAGALALAPTLLPFLTLPASVFLAANKLAGRSCWFELSAAYYLNILWLGIALAGVLVLQWAI